jgi:glycosyltransferase involved in cell wall biosynthesis
MHETKKKILMVGPLPPTVGGITTFITGILESNLNRKYKFITFGTERPTLGIVYDVRDYTLMFRVGLPCLVKSIMATTSHLLMFPFILIVKSPNLVHIHTSTYWSFWENAVYILVSNLFFKKTIVHIHGGAFDKFYKDSNYLVKFLMGKILNLPDRVIALSPKWKRFFTDLIPQNKIIVLGNFVNFSRYAQFKRKVDLPEDMIKVLFIGGAGAKTKGIYDILKAIPTIVRQHENICFVFVGCANVGELNIISKEEEIISHVRVLDYVYGDKKIKVFSNSDIFILPSYSEGFPIAMLEAMAAGLPIIATSVGAIPEVIEDGKNGFLIKTGDYNALAEKILILAKDKKLRQKMGKNNIEKIKRQYDREVVMEKLDNIYDKLLGK